ncbi:MAG TPA: acyltransferase [Sphingomicrobium sp.]|nr:acyltransferase [Sphingomicrobium sp.]
MTGYFSHDSAVVDDGAEVGAGTRIWHFTHIAQNAHIGRDVTIGQNVYVASGAVVGDRCKIQNNVAIYDGVELEDGVFCGPSMVFTNVHNPRAAVDRTAEFRPTRVAQGATLGANCTVICGVTIGRYAFVGAGAVVTHDVSDHALVTGVPARQTGWMSRHGEKLDLPVEGDGQAACPATGERYLLEGGKCRMAK